jgi:GT2 family glycosyltransferase
MDYSIIIPVFNREDLTRNCLEALPPTIAGAGTGEVIVVDNGSAPATAEVLAAFPWVRVIRNERNLGFAAACNQGARAASGRFLVHLNNDTIPLAGWLERMLAVAREPGVGIVGARLLYANNRIQHAGVMLFPARFGPEGAGPFHFLILEPADAAPAMIRTDYEAVTGACLVTPRDLYLELGGFDEAYWNGYEDVDYCYAVRARGLRVVYDPSAVLYHLESQSGVQRKRRVTHNVGLLASRWATRVPPDHNRLCGRLGFIRREAFRGLNRTFIPYKLPPISVVVHGRAPDDAAALAARIRAASPSPARILWLAAGPAPAGTEVPAAAPLEAVRALTEVRADHYVAFVDTRTQLGSNWLGELIDTLEYAEDVCAATVVPPAERAATTSPLGADARCTLINTRQWPQDVRIDAGAASIDAALVDWTHRAVALGRCVKAVPREIAQIADAPPGADYDRLRRADPARLEALSVTPPELENVFASIVMLSWNAPNFTKMAVESIKRHATSVPYEIIIIDNGSDAQTRAMLAALEDVRVIYNDVNRGFAGGCNQGLAAALGTHVVLLNNDVLVNDGWLDRLIDAHRRDPLVGVSAPRSNSVAGDQQINDASYNDGNAMLAYAAERARIWRGVHYRTDRAIGFCLCIARRVIEEVGGIDERYGAGNFEDDDFSIRVRAAGYQIVVCEDVFIHHFGSVTFKANNVDYTASMQKNWSIFAARWGLPAAYPTNGYNAEEAIRRGFVRERHYVPLPVAPANPILPGAPTEPDALAVPAESRTYAAALVAVVDGEAGWSRIGPVVTNYAKALTLDDETVLTLAVLAPLDAQTIAARVERALKKAGIEPAASPDIEITDVDDIAAWRAGVRAARVAAVERDERLAGDEPIAERSPSGLRRLLRALVSAS